jgi:hypothetical protein
MVSRGLAEGVLAPGGQVHGFLYFPRVPDTRRLPLDFGSALSDAESGDLVATLKMALVVNP